MSDTLSRATKITPGERLASLDALRGFDMFWIVGMEEFAQALGKASDAAPLQFISRQLDHVKWEGFHFLDLIFPLFVFIAGASLVFSLSKSLAERGRGPTLSKLFVRCAILFLIGVIYYGGISVGTERLRLLGVLQRIALSCFGGGLAFCFLRTRGLIALTVSILLGYWALLALVPVPGVGAGNFAEGKNLANYCDRWLPYFKWDGAHDPEGLLSTLPAVATCLLGVLAGIFLRRTDLEPMAKARQLLIAGVILAALGWAWHPLFPVIKKIWTSSYVLVAGGYSCLLLGAFYAALDVFRWRSWAAPFTWIGVNAIAIYLAHNLIDFHGLSQRFLGPHPLGEGAKDWNHVVLSVGAVTLTLLLARYLYRRNLFLRI